MTRRTRRWTRRPGSIPLAALATIGLATTPAGAQERAAPSARGDTTAALPAPAPTPAPAPAAPFRLPHAEPLFVGSLGAAVLANPILHYHPGHALPPGASPNDDRWLARDKALHAGTAFAMTYVASALGVRPWLATLGTCAAGAAFEATQRTFSCKDVTVNCVGAALAWGVRRLR
jgi:hypothetical protein